MGRLKVVSRQRVRLGAACAQAHAQPPWVTQITPAPTSPPHTHIHTYTHNPPQRLAALGARVPPVHGAHPALRTRARLRQGPSVSERPGSKRADGWHAQHGQGRTSRARRGGGAINEAVVEVERVEHEAHGHGQLRVDLLSSPRLSAGTKLSAPDIRTEMLARSLVRERGRETCS
jgi:hypothetical protein